jgi:rare lipoprotein A
MACANAFGVGAPRLFARWIALVCAALSLTACGTFSGRSTVDDTRGSPRSPDAASKRGAYYLDDGPGERAAAELDAVPDAIPRWEPLHRGTARPYSVMGRTYTPMSRLESYRARGIATWYGRRYHGQRTSSGEVYDMYAMTGAHPTLPIPSYARVTNLNNGRAVVVRINDRGPFLSERLIDLSYVAAHKLDMLRSGSALVDVETLLPGGGSASVPTAAMTAPHAAMSTEVYADGGPDVIAPPPSIGRASGHYLQLAAFAVPENAQRFLEELQAQLGAMATVLSLASAPDMYRIHAGPYATRAEALEAADRIGRILGATPILAAPR